MNGVIKAIDYLWKVLEIVVAVFLVFLATLGIAQVILRYFFSAPLGWAEEMARYMLVWITFLAGPLCIRKDQMIGLQVVVDRVPKKVKMIFGIISVIAMIVYFVVIIYMGVPFVQGGTLAKATVLPSTMATFYIIIPLGSVLMLLSVIQKFLIDYVSKDYDANTNEEVTEE